VWLLLRLVEANKKFTVLRLWAQEMQTFAIVSRRPNDLEIRIKEEDVPDYILPWVLHDHDIALTNGTPPSLPPLSPPC
jgi:hypothetical protein